ncbi:unnamed protein product [Protopolystoma xenopodis]|uniref:Uncharacterized protein n=1 Tax=Protopolystoma xenopodis TaxID=117903 RepID=A0A448WCK9_9PLAT|nr:unnamed protein product [Protopolystoma xenopodis]
MFTVRVLKVPLSTKLPPELAESSLESVRDAATVLQGRLSGLIENHQQISVTLAEANLSNQQLHDAISPHLENLRKLTQPIEQLETDFPSIQELISGKANVFLPTLLFFSLIILFFTLLYTYIFM